MQQNGSQRRRVVPMAIVEKSLPRRGEFNGYELMQSMTFREEMEEGGGEGEGRVGKCQKVQWVRIIKMSFVFQSDMKSKPLAFRYCNSNHLSTLNDFKWQKQNN